MLQFPIEVQYDAFFFNWTQLKPFKYAALPPGGEVGAQVQN